MSARIRTLARVARTATAAVAMLGVSVAAHADTKPNEWDAARDPAIGDRWNLHVAAIRDMTMDEDHSLGRLRDAYFMQARARLEQGGAAHSPDVLLRFDLGSVYEELKLHERAIQLLVPALEQAPDHPAATDAWLALAYAYAHLDRTTDECKAYERYLARETNDRARVTALMNFAEADMRLGRLDEAIAGYRATLDLAVALPSRAGMHDEVLATWGLAVALDRSGDHPGAAATARQAVRIDTAYIPATWNSPPRTVRYALITNQEFVFFVPAYERYWYLALGKTEDAKQAASAHDAARAWTTAEALWQRYVTRATADDRWLPIARLHLAHATKEKAAARLRARGTKGVDAPDELEEFLQSDVRAQR